MIVDWFFCCCANKTVEQTLAFFSAADGLDSSGSDLEVVFQALRATSDLDIVDKVYVLPRVVRQIQRLPLPPSISTQLRESYFGELLDLGYEDAVGGTPMSDLVDAVLNQVTGSRILKLVAVAARSEEVVSSVKLETKEREPSPYGSITASKAATFLLAVLSHAATVEPSKIAKALSNADDGAMDPIRILLETAGSYQLGRHCYLLATRARNEMRSTKGGDAEAGALLDILWSQEFSTDVFAPDILLLNFELMFPLAGDSGLESRQLVANKILREMVSFKVFRERQKKIVISDQIRTLRILGVKADNESLLGTLAALWLWGLWTRLARIDPTAAMASLGPFWRPRKKAFPESVEVQIPDANGGKASSEIKKIFAGLNRANDGPQPRYNITGGERLKFARTEQWHLLSPWMRFESSGTYYKRYPLHKPVGDKHKHYLTILRTLFGLDVTLKILTSETLAPCSNGERDVFLAFLVHARDVLHTFGKRSNSKKYSKLPLDYYSVQMESLFCGAAIRADNIGAGWYPAIQPRNFVDLAVAWKDSDDHEEQTFANLVLPEVLIEWLSNAYRQAWNNHSGPGRWIGLARTVGELFEEATRKLPTSENGKTAPDRPVTIRQIHWLLAKFLGYPEIVEIERREQQVEIVNTYINDKKNFAKTRRRVLFALDASVGDWENGGYAEKWLEHVRDTEQKQFELFLLTLRLGAYCRQNGESSPERGHDWAQELEAALLTARERLLFDRFHCIALVDLLGEPAVIERRPLWNAIWVVLLQFGGTYEIKAFAERLAGAWCERLAGTRQLINLPSVIWRYLEGGQTDLDDVGIRKPNFIYEEAGEQKRRQILNDLMVLAVRIAGSTTISAIKELIDTREHLIGQRVNEVNFHVRRQTERIASSNPDKLPTLRILGDGRVSVLSIRAAVWDPNRFEVTFDQVGGVDHRTLDLFSMSRNQLKEFDSQVSRRMHAGSQKPAYETFHFLAPMVLDAAEDTYLDRRDGAKQPAFKLTVNPGLRTPATLNLRIPEKSVPTKPELGDIVELELDLVRRVNKEKKEVQYWAPQKTGQVRVHRWNEAGQTLVFFDVTEKGKLDGTGTDVTVKPRDSKQQLRAGEEPDNWNFDLSRAFRIRTTAYSFSALRQGETGSNKIVIRFGSFLDLVMKLCRDGADYAFLAYSGEKGEDFEGREFLTFSTRPGELFKIFTTEMSSELSGRIEDVLAFYHQKSIDSEGLLIAVRPIIRNARVELDPVDAGRDLTPLEAFEDPTYPIDDRNIRWRYAFHNIDWDGVNDDEYDGRLIQYVTAHRTRDDRGWEAFLPVSVPGFPEVVPVRLSDQHRIAADAQEWGVEVTDWNPNLSRHNVMRDPLPEIAGEAVSVLEFNQAKAASMSDALDKHYHSGRGTVFRLSKPLSVDSSGYVRSLSDHKVLLNIETDSLLLDWVEENEPNLHGKIGRDRPVVITHRQDRRGKWGSPRFSIESIDALRRLCKGTEEVEGILTRRPYPGKGNSSEDSHTSASVPLACEIYWQTGEDWVGLDMHIENLAETKDLYIGTVIRVTALTGDPIISTRNIFLYGRALWSLTDEKLKDCELIPLGPTQVQGDSSKSKKDTFILGSGKLARFDVDQDTPRESYRTILNLDSQEGCRFFLPNLERDKRQFPRCFLRRNRRSMWGRAHKNSASGDVVVENIVVRLMPYNTDSGVFYDAERTFHVKRRQTLSGRTQPTKQVRSRAKGRHWDEWLEEYLNDPRPLRGQVTHHGMQLFFKIEDAENICNPIDLPIPPHLGPYQEHHQYHPSGMAVLVEGELEPGRLAASLRSVDPIDSIEELRLQYSGFEEDSLISLDDTGDDMFYVGADKKIGQERQVVYHRFEVGYGQTIVLPEEDLQYQGQPFQAGELRLFYGDRIKAIRFVSEPPPPQSWESQLQSEENQYDRMVLSIESVEWSDGRTLYSQASKYKIVHVLTVVGHADGIEVKTVEGFMSRSIDTDVDDFSASRITFNPESHDRLYERTLRKIEASGEPTVEFKVLGILNVLKYLEEEGRNIEFNHVRLSYEPEGSTPPLEGFNRVFMKTGRIYPLAHGNDLGLALLRMDGLDFEDIGDEFREQRSVLMTRRKFSVREDLLKKIHDGKKYFGDRPILVALERPAANEKIFASLYEDNMPPRAPSVLRKILTRDREGVFCSYMREFQEGGNTYHSVELKPGVRVDFKHWEADIRAQSLSKGDILKITLADGPSGAASKPHLIVERAAFSDEWYVGHAERPAVIFPKQSLLDDRKIQSQRDPVQLLGKGKIFTAGGLPDVELQPLPSRNGEGETRDLLVLMMQAHPKIGLIKKFEDQHGRDCLGVRETRIHEDIASYRIHVDEKTLHLEVSKVGNLSDNPGTRRPHWAEFTYALQESEKIAWRMSAVEWVFHDRTTARWAWYEDHWHIPGIDDVPPGSCHDGPVFLVERNGSLTARYDVRKLRRHGFPVRNLFEILRRLRGRRDGWRADRIPVAVVSVKNDAIWVEVVPGYVVEIPIKICFWEFGSTELSWDAFDIQLIGIGDTLSVALLETETPLAVDRLSVRWEYGGLGLFNHSAGIVPLHEERDISGGTVFGAGTYTFTLPRARGERFPDNLFFETDGYYRAFSATERIQAGTVALLYYDADLKKPVLHGVPGISVVADRASLDDSVARNDLLTQRIFRPWKGRVQFSNDVSNWIEACGGAIPVTVEDLLASSNIVFVSRRLQAKAWAPKRRGYAQAKVVGINVDTFDVVLRCGPQLLLIHVTDIVTGLNDRDNEQLREVLFSLDTWKEPIWIHWNEEGRPSSGVRPVADPSFHVWLAEPVTLQGSETPLGVICLCEKTRSIHWLGIQDLAWASLDKFELERLISETNGPVTAVMKFNSNRSPISVIDERMAARMFRNLRIGSTVQCRPLFPRNLLDGHVLVESATTDTIFSLSLPDKGNWDDITGGKTNRLLTVQVIDKVSGKRNEITAALQRHVPYLLNVPDWFFGNEIRVRACASRDFLVRLRDHPEIEPSPLDLNRHYEDWDRMLVTQWLDHAYFHLKDEAYSLANGCRAACALNRQLDYDAWIPLLPALKAVVILHEACQPENVTRIKDWRREDAGPDVEEMWAKCLVNIIQRTHLRALNSFHMEVLLRYLVMSAEDRNMGGPWNRFWSFFDDLERSGTSQLDSTAYSGLLRFLEATAIAYSGHDSFPAVNALSACIGKPLNLIRLREDAILLTKLTRLTRSFPKMAREQKNVRIDDTIASEFASLIGSLEEHAYEIPLLSEVPT
ncbi:hypothetical protein [Rhodobium gokarnense]|uniref:Uncharacterized protein n=1 Tax=Rhodobium gokarnense TaxID=364296 RepID=A0ABT3HEN5_9HYPH|nr:hypothetical protein [Rhodobium gokarnense]MCW2308873.1 hypothetical protein [Rhodobium gokarnense]